MNHFLDELKAYQNKIVTALPIFYLNQKTPDITAEAALYSLMAGGKRIRPVLSLSVAKCLEVSEEKILPFACAVEMIHTYSLIHDDLPCMDDDDLRRGNPTCHVKYSEAIALLAGDSLLNRAYHLLFSLAAKENDFSYVRAAEYLAQMAGNEGMIGGQTIDMVSEGKLIDVTTLKELHSKKTGAIFKASIMMPVILSKKEEVYSSFSDFSEHIGLAFQIKDDILDALSTNEVLGKSVGKDAAAQKSTYVSMYGIERAEKMLEQETKVTHDILSKLGEKGLDTRFLVELNQYLLSREN